MIRPHVIVAGIKVAPFILFAQFTWLRKYSKHPEKTPIEVRYKKVRKLICRIIKALRLDIKVNNMEYITNHVGTYLGVSNHRNFLDPIFYIYLSEKPVSFVAKIEADKIPFVSRVIRSIDGFYIDRDDVMSQVRLFKNVASRLERNDLSYFVFAEGTRMKNPSQIETLPYKDGSIKPAYWAKKDIIYVASYGTHNVMGKKSKHFKKRNVTFEIHKPILYDEFKDKPTTVVMPMIESITNRSLHKIAEENASRNLR